MTHTDMNRTDLRLYFLLATTVVSLFAAGYFWYRGRPATDSPVKVVGGSMHFMDDSGWSCTSSPDTCTSAQVDTTKLQLENVKLGIKPYTPYPVGHPPNPITVAGRPWQINVIASDDNDKPDPTHSVVLCTSSKIGVCDLSAPSPPSSPSPFVTAKPMSGDGFYPKDSANDKRYHNGIMSDCTSGGTKSCPTGHCEDMKRIDVTIGGVTTPYVCITSAECKIQIGPAKP